MQLTTCMQLFAVHVVDVRISYADHSRKEPVGQDSLNVQRPIMIVSNQRHKLDRYFFGPLKQQRARKIGGATGSQFQGPWLKLPALCH